MSLHFFVLCVVFHSDLSVFLLFYSSLYSGELYVLFVIFSLLENSISLSLPLCPSPSVHIALKLSIFCGVFEFRHLFVYDKIERFHGNACIRYIMQTASYDSMNLFESIEYMYKYN